MDLVILAGGMGSRFGGLKQLQPIDDDNNFIIDYSIYDAIKAGFDRVIFIIREENYEDFKTTIGNRLSNVIEVKYVFQRMEDVPPGIVVPPHRIKPWGTAQAMYTIRDVVSDRFAMINADDFYGYESFRIVANYLRTNPDNEFANIGYYVKNTLSDKGAVKRGVLEVENGFVTSLTESKVEMRGDKIFATPLAEDSWKEIPENTLVSMNMFGFTRNLLPPLGEYCKNFFKSANLETDECLIPEVINRMTKNNEVKLRIKNSSAKWYGITYKEDLIEFKKAIKQMVDNGEYPKHLYS